MANKSENKNVVALKYSHLGAVYLATLVADGVPQISETVAAGALESLTELGVDTEAFQAWIEENFPETEGARRGKAPLEVGGFKDYTSTNVEGAPQSTIRLPVNALGGNPGGFVRCECRTVEEMKAILARLPNDAVVIMAQAI